MLEFKDLWFKYSEEYILKGVSGKVEWGKALAIVGPTGCGKSTLLFVLSGLLKPERGVVRLDGGEIKKKDVGLLFQTPDDQLFNPTVFDEIAYSLRTMGIGENEVKKKVAEIAQYLGIEGLLHKKPHKLSVGQKKLVALASVLVYDPPVLLLDEPSTNLDARSLEKIRRVMADWKKSNRIVIFSTHDPDFALEMADEICELEGGVLKCMDLEEFIDELLSNRTPLPLSLSLRMVRDHLNLKQLLPRYKR